MSSQSFRWRTILEVAVISIVIYVFLGTPGLPSSSGGESSSNGRDIPVARAKTESLVYPDKNLQCPRHDFDIHVFSASPLVIYIDGFVSEEEAEHLVDIRHMAPTVPDVHTKLTCKAVRANGKSLQYSMTALRLRTIRSANRRRRSSIETQRYNASSSELSRFRAGRRRLSSNASGHNAITSVDTTHITTIGPRRASIHGE